MGKKQQRLLFIVLLHLVIGFLMTDRTISKSLSIVLLFVGFMTILATKNKNQEAVLWSAYIVGAEVLFRMSKGLIFYELPKYMVFLFLLTGLLIEKKKHNISPVFIIYIMLLLFGITFSDIPYPASIRTNIIFNLSGPILLGLCAMYFYQRKLNLNTVINCMYYLLLPMLSMVSYLYFKTPNLKEIIFTANSNFQVSAGYGPNQVATILGLGSFAFIVLLIYNRRISGFIILDIFLGTYVIYRALLTLSRGGLITGLLAVLCFIAFYILSKKDRFKYVFKFSIVFIVFGISLWIYTSSITNGMLDNRYTNKGTKGGYKKDLTTGRVDLFINEWEYFLNSPFFGIGVGTIKYYRQRDHKILLPTHNEMSRLLGEHGVIGIFILMLLAFVPIINLKNASILNKAFASAFLIFWFLTVNHSAMRLAMPAFVYGLGVMTVVNNKETIIVKSLSE